MKKTNVIAKGDALFCEKCNVELSVTPGFWLKTCQNCGERIYWQPQVDHTEYVLKRLKKRLERNFDGSVCNLIAFLHENNVLNQDDIKQLKEFTEKL